LKTCCAVSREDVDMDQSEKTFLKATYRKLLKEFGPQHWWPARTRFEVIVGAILTQNTNWKNVEKALDNLRKRKLLNLSGIKETPARRLADLIRPSGYFNVKAKRLKNFIEFMLEGYEGSIRRMMKEPLSEIRPKILGVNGVGPETADSILLYALDKPVFVVDAYTKRILHRHQLIPSEATYDDVQKMFMNNLAADGKIFNEYHALLVKLCKEFCKTKPLCAKCPLNNSGELLKVF